jgi:hypothetical protein
LHVFTCSLTAGRASLVHSIQTYDGLCSLLHVELLIAARLSRLMRALQECHATWARRAKAQLHALKGWQAARLLEKDDSADGRLQAYFNSELVGLVADVRELRGLGHSVPREIEGEVKARRQCARYLGYAECLRTGSFGFLMVACLHEQSYRVVPCRVPRHHACPFVPCSSSPTIYALLCQARRLDARHHDSSGLSWCRSPRSSTTTACCCSRSQTSTTASQARCWSATSRACLSTRRRAPSRLHRTVLSPLRGIT